MLGAVVIDKLLQCVLHWTIKLLSHYSKYAHCRQLVILQYVATCLFMAIKKTKSEWLLSLKCIQWFVNKLNVTTWLIIIVARIVSGSRTDGDILRLLPVTCCSQLCLRKLSIEDISYCENIFKCKEQTARRNEILQYLHKHSKQLYDGGYNTEFIAAGKIVCKEAWLLIHDVNHETFRRIYKEFTKGTLLLEHGNAGFKRTSQKTKDCIAWLQFFVNCVGQHQPDQSVIHLPSCFTLHSIYKQMVKDNDGFGIKSVSLSQFYSIFSKEFKNVTIPKVKCYKLFLQN